MSQSNYDLDAELDEALEALIRAVQRLRGQEYLLWSREATHAHALGYATGVLDRLYREGYVEAEPE
jgi:hypothetical protein